MNHRSKLLTLAILIAFVGVLSFTATLQAQNLVTCQVSGKEIKKSEAKGSMEYEGKTYYFCCENCKDSFVKDPEKYINSEPGEHHEHGEDQEPGESHEHGEHQEPGESHEHGEHQEPGEEHGGDAAVKCLVMGHEIGDLEEAESHEYKGKTYYFCCAGCKEKFVKDPEKYVKSNGDKIICPVNGNEVKDPEKATSSVYKGKTYYFCCPGCKEPFDKDPEKYLNKK